MERKPRRRTKERILEASLRLFNEFGEPNVTTSLVAGDLNISPGNLYYHYRNKEEIVSALFGELEREMLAVVAAARPPALYLDGVSRLARGIFEVIWRYRFLYRDVNDILTRNRTVELRFRQLLDALGITAQQVCNGLIAAGEMDATPDQVERLALNQVLVSTYWLSYEHILQPRRSDAAETIRRGVVQVLSMAVPYLRGASRTLIEQVMREELAV